MPAYPFFPRFHASPAIGRQLTSPHLTPVTPHNLPPPNPAAMIQSKPRMPHSTALTTPPPSPAEARRARRARALIVLSVLVFVGAQFLLYYRWVTLREPTCVLIVETSTELRGATIEVSGPWTSEPYESVVGSGERFSLPFYLEPGRYDVRLEQHGQTLFEGQVMMTRDARAQRIDLSALEPAPTTAPSDDKDAKPPPAPRDSFGGLTRP